MPEFEPTIKTTELQIIKQPPLQPSRRRFLVGSLALAYLLAQEPNLAMAAPVTKPKPPQVDDQIFHTQILDRFGLTEISHGKNTITGSLSLTPAEDLQQHLDALNLFQSGKIYSPILEEYMFADQLLAYNIAGLVNPRTPKTPYQISIEVVSLPKTLAVVRTPWLSSEDLNAIQNLIIGWENGELIEATSISR